MSKFYDAADVRNYPHGQPACFYGDGRNAVTASDIVAIGPPEHRLITTQANPRRCSILDGRPDFALTPAQVRGFVRGRKGRNQDAILYSDREMVVEYQRILLDDDHGDLASYERLYWWIATLDGIDWTPRDLAADLAANYHATLDPGRIWGNQNNQLPELGAGALVDQSELFLAWRP